MSIDCITYCVQLRCAQCGDSLLLPSGKASGLKADAKYTAGEASKTEFFEGPGGDLWSREKP